MSEQKVQTWLRQLIACSGSVAKRRPRSFHRWVDQTEQLEARQFLSAVMGIEELPIPVEVASPVVETLSKTAKHKHHQAHGKAAPEFPVVTGTWGLTASVVLDGDPPIVFNGTVQISQNKGKISGNVQLSGLPLFTIKGKLSRQDVNDLHGSTKFPVEISEGNFRGVKGKLDLHFNQDLQGFTGTVNRSIFGFTIEIDLTGTKQP